MKSEFSIKVNMEGDSVVITQTTKMSLAQFIRFKHDAAAFQKGIGHDQLNDVLPPAEESDK